MTYTNCPMTCLLQKVVMEGKVAVILLASVFSVVLLARHATAEPLEDQLPDTTGLFFGKRFVSLLP